MPIFARILDEKYIKTFFMINPIVKTIELPDGEPSHSKRESWQNRQTVL